VVFSLNSSWHYPASWCGMVGSTDHVNWPMVCFACGSTARMNNANIKFGSEIINAQKKNKKFHVDS